MAIYVENFNNPILDYNKKTNGCEFRVSGRSMISLEGDLTDRLKECICILSDSECYKEICTDEIKKICVAK